MTTDHYSKFSPKAEIYDRYRWDFHPSAIAELCTIAHINQDSVVADIGSGTGMLTAHFVDKVKEIYAIEPNLEMRAIAESDLAKYKAFISVDALADATTLPDNSVDLIIVGRAIHWFNPETTKKEFLRILKPDGWLAIGRVNCEDLELFEVLKTLRKKEYGWNVSEDKSMIIEKDKLPDYYFDKSQLIKHDSIITENWQQFIGRMMSHSPAPNSDNPFFSEFEKVAKNIFNKYSSQGNLQIKISTIMKLGKIK